MTFGQRLVAAREAKGLKQKELAAALNISSTRLNYWEKDKRQPEIEMIRALSNALDVTTDYLIGNEVIKKSPALSSEAQHVAEDFEALDQHGRRVVRVVMDEELSRMAEKAASKPDISPAEKEIPLFGAFFAAGAAEPDFGNPPDKVRVPASSPADFAVRINGTSMQPYLKDQSVAFGVFRNPRDGEVGVFLLNGAFLVKQFFHDHLDNLYFMSLNRQEADQDVTLWASQLEDAQLTVFGTILMDHRPPRPNI